MLFLLGLAASYVGMLAARGNGFILAGYFLIGAFPIAMTAHYLGRRLGSARRAQVAILLVGAISCATLAYVTSRRPASEVFQQAFGIAAPANVVFERARVQWFDGEVAVLILTCDDTSFQQMIAARSFEPGDTLNHGETVEERRRSFRSWWVANLGMLGHLADSEFADPPSIETPQGYQVQWTAGDRYDCAAMVRDPVSGRTWVYHSWTS